MSLVKTFVAAGVLAVTTCASPPAAAAPGHPPATQAPWQVVSCTNTNVAREPAFVFSRRGRERAGVRGRAMG